MTGSLKNRDLYPAGPGQNKDFTLLRGHLRYRIRPVASWWLKYLEPDFSASKEFHAALDQFMAQLPKRPCLAFDQLLRSHNTICNEIGVKEFCSRNSAPLLREIVELIKAEHFQGNFPAYVPRDSQMAALLFPQTYQIHTEDGLVYALANQARDNYGNAIAAWGKELEVFTQGPVLTLTFVDAHEPEVEFSREILFSKAALREGIARLATYTPDPESVLDEHPYLLWLALESIASQSPESEFKWKQALEILTVDPLKKSLTLKLASGTYEIIYELRTQDSIPLAHCSLVA